ncbi:MAG: hypothetical protein ABIW50_01485 [Candidatus Limnocylindria bacterium]
MVIAALAAFALLLIAWIFAPSGAPKRENSMVEPEAAALAA